MHARNFNFRQFFLWPLLCIAISAKGYTVTGLTATYSNGQVFLTWKNPDASNLVYKVYRTASKITAPSQLSTANYIGYVRDNSAKNIRKSSLQNGNFYFTINPGGEPLDPGSGLYVATSMDNKRHYYAVMVMNLEDSVEDKTIDDGNNTLSSAIRGHKVAPQPILQSVVEKINGDTNYEYTIWGDNQDIYYYPAFNNCGSYGYDFTVVRRKPGTAGPLYVSFFDDDPFQMAGSAVCSDCNILQLDDWLPNGENTYWLGYNIHYDMYSKSNPVQNSGIVRTYTQNRMHQILTWAISQPNVDSTRVYCTGFSHNGFGAMFTSVMMPSLIAATQMTSSPCLVKAVKGTDKETKWCGCKINLNTDMVNPGTGDTLQIWSLLDLRKMFYTFSKTDLPYMSGVNGKQDITVGWVQNFHWFDSLNLNRQGGVWFWDQRDHSGNGKNFDPEETDLNFLRFSTTRSFPAFAYNLINENPGDGDINNGDPYGSINGYLDWDDKSIDDQSCSYSINCFIKDFYVGGVQQPEFDSTSVDITLRRLQNFHPANGQVIEWSVTKKNKKKIIQQGSFTYNTGPITLYGVKIYNKKGSTISLQIDNCGKNGNPTEILSPDQLVTVAKTGGDYEVSVTLSSPSNVEVKVVDMMGRTINDCTMAMQEGCNKFSLAMYPGAYILQVKAAGFSESKKLIF